MFDGDEAELAEEEERRALTLLYHEIAAVDPKPMTLELASIYAASESFITPLAHTMTHTCRTHANWPCEDSPGTAEFRGRESNTTTWTMWSILDGHAGPQTATVLSRKLAEVLPIRLVESGCLRRPYTSNDAHIIEIIKRSFLDIDRAFLWPYSSPSDESRPFPFKAQGELVSDMQRGLQGDARDLANPIAGLAAAMSGSCALVGLYDQGNSVLRIANTGDSRAVLGRFDTASQRYIARPLSTDQTGFNELEAKRLEHEHSGESPVDPKTGRVHGLAVTRAFGDSRWKWPKEITQLVHDNLWGPAALPNDAIQTPPYLTAEPEVTETKIQTGEHPDFLIMASDGLWDHFSSEDAVTCVQQWLEKFDAAAVPDTSGPGLIDEVRGFAKLKASVRPSGTELEEDTYRDDKGQLRWHVSPKHFVVEDENCGVHLVKNALGGKRRNLFRAVMSVQPPRAREVRDDITVKVIFFGVVDEAGKKI